MILIIDNYDSFTYNLVQYIGEIDRDLMVYRNDRINLTKIEEIDPRLIVISPGPGTPEMAGISISVIREFGARIPILGICLGHQAIVEAYDGKIIRSQQVVHGKTAEIITVDSPIFSGIPERFSATRYHSLVADRDAVPDVLKVIAVTEDGIIMGVEHRSNPVFGLQFHPESIATKYGKQMIRNFLEQ